MKPKLNQLVHYVSYGTPNGEYPPTCRAAIITEVGQWVTMKSENVHSHSTSGGWSIRHLEQWFIDDAVALLVFNPTGLFFNGAGAVACRYVPYDGDDGGDVASLVGGSWHESDHS